MRFKNQILKSIFLLLLVGFAPDALAQYFTVGPSNIKIQPGQEFTLNINKASGVGSEPISAFQTTVYVPEGLALMKVTKGSALPESFEALPAITGNGETGNVTVMVLETTSITGYGFDQGELLQLTFRADYNSSPSTPSISFSNSLVVFPTGSEHSVTSTGSMPIVEIEVPLNSVSISAANGKTILRDGETVQLIAETQPSNATEPITYAWSSDDDLIASVTNEGLVKAGAKTGTTTITVKANNSAGHEVSGTIQITVEATPATSVTLNFQNLNLFIGQSKTLMASVNPVNATDKNVTWSSQNPGVATVGNDGTVNAVSKGTTIITATCGTVSADCQVMVYDNTDITINPGTGTTEGNEDDTPAGNTGYGGSLNGSDLTLRVNQKGVISLQLPSGLTQAPILEWAVAPGGDAYVSLQKISDVEASFTGQAMGATKYYVNVEGETDPIIQGNITVIAQNPMTSLSLNPTQISVAQNAEDFQIKAIFSPVDADGSLLTWSSSQPSVATVTNNGTVSVLTQGHTIITVTANDGSELSATCDVTVTKPIDINFGFDLNDAVMDDMNEISIYLGNSYQFKPKAQEGFDIPSNITWTSSDAQTVYVNNDGTVQGIKIGSADITASAIFNSNTLTATCKVNVLPIPASSIKLNAENLNLFVGQSATLKAEIEPQNTTDKTVTWESENPSVASVADGKVTGIKASDTPVNIIAKCGNATAVCQVTVSGNENVEILPGTGTEEGDEGKSPADNTNENGSIIGNDLTLRVGQTAAILVKLPDDLSTNPELEWSLANGGAELVTMNVGQNTITASFTGKKMGVTSYSITLKGQKEAITGGTITIIAQTPMKSLELEPATLSLAKNANPVQLTPKFTPLDASETTLIWSSSRTDVATVSNEGLVTPVNRGETVIMAKTQDGSELTAICNVTVTNPIDNNFGFNFNDAVTGGVEGISIYLGDSYKLQPKAQEGYDLPEGISWSSNNPQIVSVEQDGTVKGLQLGSAEITASATFNGENLSATCKVNVIAVPATEIQLNTKGASIYIGETVTIEATVKPDNTTYPAITWSSNNTGVATVGTNGLVTGISEGQATITARCGDVVAYCTIYVKPIEAESIEMKVEDVTLLLGEKTILSAKVLPPTTTYPTITWTSEDSSIVSVTSDGTITAVALGTTTITARCGNVSATCKVTVNPVPAESIEMEVENVELFVGGSTRLIAQVLPQNTTYPTITWSTSNSAIATVSSDGTVTAIAEGNTTITATCGKVSSICNVTVKPVPSEGIAVNPDAVTLLVGANVTLTASVMPSNTTDKNVIWTSDNSAVATVSSSGTVTAVSPGTAIITAKNGSNTATCKVTVNPITSTSVTLNVANLTLKVGATSTLTATISPSNTTDKTLTWTSGNTSVATVSSEGVVTAVAPGTAVITVSNGTSTATCEVTVLANTATSVSLNIEDQTIYVASTTQLIATVSPESVTDDTVTWTSNDTSVATVDANGLVTGVSAGEATITATCGSVSASCIITVIARETDPINVTTSELNIIAKDGEQVLMWVSTEGGNPEGWSFNWSYNGEAVSTEKNLEVTVHNMNEVPVTESYIVNVRNLNDGALIYNETFTFTIEIWPKVELPFEDDSNNESQIGNNDGTIQDEDGWWERNGIHVETLKTREGNDVSMYSEAPQGGYNNAWVYEWTINGQEIGQEQEIVYKASMASGNTMEISAQTPLVTLTNFGPEGDVGYQSSAYGPTIDVYRRPLTPLQMLRKGDGKSHIFIIMMPISNAQVNDYAYQFVYGYTDNQGVSHIMEETPLRYCQAESDVYNDMQNNFWAYSVWHYTDGSVVTSGLRYLDGTEDESFDGSIFTGEGLKHLSGHGNSVTSIYTIDGQYMGSDSDRLAPGIYIRQVIREGVSTSEKFIVR